MPRGNVNHNRMPDGSVVQRLPDGIRARSISLNPIKQAAQMRAAADRPVCPVCGLTVLEPGVGRTKDWYELYGHRNVAGDPCDGRYVLRKDLPFASRGKL